jgi:phosphoglucosamine mutase
VFGADGFKLPDEAEAEIERLMNDASLLGARKTGPEIGRAERLRGALGRYVVFAKTTFPRDLSLEGVRMVVDAAHGAAYKAAPHVFVELGARVTAIGVRPNGLNINREAGALHPRAAVEEVLRRRAAIGIALDGDADRVIFIDEQGQVVDGDAVLALCAQEMTERRLLRNAAVVATVMSNLGLERALQRHGLRLERTPVGDRYVVEAMRQGGYNLGGEQSGHLIFLDHASTGDGIIAALQVLAVMRRTGRPLSELARSAMERVPQVLENLTLPSKRPLEEMDALTAAIGAAQRALGADGRVLVRWSGTEPKLRIMVEGPDEQGIRALAQEMAAAARRDLSA